MPNHFTWVPWFKELAANIRDGDRGYFAERVERVDWQGAITESGNDNIDPLSFFSFLSMKNTSRQFVPVYRSVHKTFEMKAPFPAAADDEGPIIPSPQRPSGLFHDGKTFDPDLLWETFLDVAQTSPTDDRGADERFLRVLEIEGVGVAQLTLTFYLVNPELYLPIDGNLREALRGKVSPSPNQWNASIKDGGRSAYFEIIRPIRQMFPECAPYEINTFLFMLQQSGGDGLARRDRRYFQVSSRVMNDNEDYWEETSDSRGPFKTARCVYTGGPGDQRTYPLTAARPGDVILVRYGQQEGRAIGVVEKNAYSEQDGFNDRAVIHVFWINKTTAALDGLPRIGFSRAGQATVNAFRTVESYRKSLGVLDQLSTPTDSSSSSSTESSSGESLESRVDAIPPAYDAAGHPLNTILYGPPGTGKTYATFRKCVEICDGQAPQSAEEIQARYKELTEKGRVEFVTFHQSCGYEEFVEGLRPQMPKAGDTTHGFRLKATDGVLKRIAKRAAKFAAQAHVLVIDEINRANVSKVMGELVTLLEEDKREGAANRLAVTLPHSHESFSLPRNLHILGTMNTADRSIALLDTALRRRFAFEELPPRPELLEVVGGVDLPAVLRAINERLEWFIDRDHLIGHAWLMGARNREDIDNAMRRKVIPLVAEYFYDDWAKVRAVFGGGDDFVKREKLPAPPNYSDEGEDRYRWTIRDEFPDDAYRRLTGLGAGAPTRNPEDGDGE